MKKFFAVFAIVTMISGAAFAACPADIDGDGNVGFTDLTSVLGAWGACDGCSPDLDGDGNVGFTDLTSVLGAWGACPVTFEPCDDVGDVDFMAAPGGPMPLGAGVIDGVCTMIFGTGIPAGITLFANVSECNANCAGCADNTDCAADEYCNFTDGTCGADLLGVCEPRAEICSTIYDPVCTCDYTIASNTCVATILGLTVMFDGECAQEDVCNHNGGTWDVDAGECICPAGTEYNYQRGCEAI